MKVYGVELLPEHEAEIMERMRDKTGVPDYKTFDFTGLAAFISRLGYDQPLVAGRMADRLIQRERKAGNIRQVRRGLWVWWDRPWNKVENSNA